MNGCRTSALIAPGAFKNPNNVRKTLMKRTRLTTLNLLFCVAVCNPNWALARSSPAASAGQQQATPERDGQHDFDFNLGTWHTHIKRILNPLSGSTKSVELNGTVTVRKIW